MNHPLCGYFCPMSQARLSIITVTFNAATDLQATIASIRQQGITGLEWIVADGGSRDGTLEVIKANTDLITCWISEPDKGIYDAMNKGLAMATGEWVMFLNAGDILESADTLMQILANLDGYDMVYGDTRVIDQDFNPVGMRHFIPPEHLTWKDFRRGMVVCHQAIISRRSLTPLYDADFRIAGDIDWAIRLVKNCPKTHFLGFITTRFKQDGASTRYRWTGIRERFRVMVRYYGLLPTLFSNMVLAVKYLVSLRWIRNVRK